MAVKPIPDGYHTVTAYLIVDGANAAIEFYKKAFGATELFRMPGPGGAVMHAEIMIGDSPVMLADQNPNWGAHAPQKYGGSPVHMLIYVEDADARFDQAVKAGATVVRPLQDQFYGDRSGTVLDPFGHQWSIATHKEDLTPEQIGERFKAMCGGG